MPPLHLAAQQHGHADVVRLLLHRADGGFDPASSLRRTMNARPTAAAATGPHPSIGYRSWARYSRLVRILLSWAAVDDDDDGGGGIAAAEASCAQTSDGRCLREGEGEPRRSQSSSSSILPFSARQLRSPYLCVVVLVVIVVIVIVYLFVDVVVVVVVVIFVAVVIVVVVIVRSASLLLSSSALPLSTFHPIMLIVVIVPPPPPLSRPPLPHHLTRQL
jgi:hypothetical protein